MSGILYLVGTPIGNLSDFSPRAKRTLESVDFIAAEDTRVTLKLLNYFNIYKPMVSYFEHNRVGSGQKILSRLQEGESCALVTDAGMPAISDPGEDLVRLCAENGVTVITVPGPCAAVSALAASGLPTQRFCFEGFLSTSKKSRSQHLESLKEESRTMIFYEAPHKLVNTLHDMLQAFGDRKIALCRELTKLHEEVIRTTLSGAITLFEEERYPKGEFVLILHGAEQKNRSKLSAEEALTLVTQYREEGKSLKEAAKLAATESGYSKNELYDLAVKQH
ncbi:MAG: 16S rRNA (cytidine(1402)-2'-O)-methyltransferase [Oscillospiraceae bacterium]|jgi:16S rRNA (cytidine1402-2'-O)-methyltransferase